METIHIHKLVQMLDATYESVYRKYGKYIVNGFIDISAFNLNKKVA